MAKTLSGFCILKKDENAVSYTSYVRQNLLPTPPK